MRQNKAIISQCPTVAKFYMSEVGKSDGTDASCKLAFYSVEYVQGIIQGIYAIHNNVWLCQLPLKNLLESVKALHKHIHIWFTRICFLWQSLITSLVNRMHLLIKQKRSNTSTCNTLRLYFLNNFHWELIQESSCKWGCIHLKIKAELIVLESFSLGT